MEPRQFVSQKLQTDVGSQTMVAVIAQRSLAFATKADADMASMAAGRGLKSAMEPGGIGPGSGVTPCGYRPSCQPRNEA
jgi:hypothetical protein